ncbi:hypothetical protein [Actinomyces qiguomingii]|uniref:hypothetical protein n=1 Tax=Actinomyces qiguomingii TaxID=2057800 RepID=UPI000CA04A85|nr:hypothetical protein [Actinomyces qiguomingii]
MNAPSQGTAAVAAKNARPPTLVRVTIVLALALMILLPFVSCIEKGQTYMHHWLSNQDAVARAAVYCVPYMETGCSLTAKVTLVPDTSAKSAAAVFNGALEESMRSSLVTANEFRISLEWQYGSTAVIRHGGMTIPYPSTSGEITAEQLTAKTRTRRVELLDIATDLAEDGVQSVDVGLGSLVLERGEVDEVPSTLLAHRLFSDRFTDVRLIDRFTTYGGWSVEITSTPVNQPPREVIEKVTSIQLEPGIEPKLSIDTTNTYPGNELQPTIEVRGLPLGDEDTPALDHAAPILAAIDGAQGFTDVKLCTAAGAVKGTSGYSCVYYDMHDGKVDRDSGYPREQSREVYDAAQRL